MEGSQLKRNYHPWFQYIQQNYSQSQLDSYNKKRLQDFQSNQCNKHYFCRRYKSSWWCRWYLLYKSYIFEKHKYKIKEDKTNQLTF